MKLINKNTGYALLLCSLLVAGGCKKLLEENPKSNVTPLSFATPQGILGGIAGVYNQMRSMWGTEGFTIGQMAGTDEYLMGASAGNPRIFSYNGITGSDFSGGFGIYASINVLNGILELGSTSGIEANKLRIERNIPISLNKVKINIGSQELRLPEICF